MKYWPLILLTLVSAAGCRVPDNCVPQSTRCAGNVAEICNANRNWQTQLDCTRVSQHSGTPFVCQAVSEQTEDGPIEGHTCMPAGSVGAAGASATAENGDAQ